MKRFAAIVHISVDDVTQPVTRMDVMKALKRCLLIDLDTEEGDPRPVTGVTVDLDSITYYDDQGGKPPHVALVP